MARPTDGNEPGENTDAVDHPDLTGVAGEMRAQWRAEQASAAADAAAQWRHHRSVADWLRDRMHAGDRVGVTLAAAEFVGRVEEVGDDFLALRGPDGRVEIQIATAVPIAFSVVEHATSGGTRSVMRRAFRDVLSERDGRVGMRVGTTLRPEGIDGTLLVGRDLVTIVAADSRETLVPIAHVAWVTATRPGSGSARL